MTGAVLIVDDSLTVRMDLADAFESGGLEPIPVATAGEARAALVRRPVDVIILDVNLPDADGIEFLQEVRAMPHRDATPVLLLSTESEIKDRLRGLRKGADEYVGKPYDSSYVVARARQLIGATPPPEHPGSSVLLIDDSRTLRMELQEALERNGYSVRTAETGEEGLRMAADRRPDVIVVDRILPGADGITVIRRVRMDPALRHVPCLLLTASTDEGVELDVLDAGADAFVHKDEDTSVLFAKLAAVLRRSSTPMSAAQPGSLHGPTKVLVVSAEPASLDTVTTCLRADGYEVVAARTGASALDLLTAQPVDCVLLDLSSGTGLCRRIRAVPELRDIPLMVVDTGGDPTAVLAGLAAGADDHVRRSDDPEILRARVRAQLRRKHFQDENRRAHDERLRRELASAEARAARELAQARAELIDELEWKNSELEAFNYSVSHDLRNPLQVIDGFSEILAEDFGAVLGETGRRYAAGIHTAARRMGELISSLLQLSHASRAELTHESVDLSAVAGAAVDGLRRRDPDRRIDVRIQAGMTAHGDAGLLAVVLENLIGNAWKYTLHTDAPRITVDVVRAGGRTVFRVGDNGAGFSMEHAGNLFHPYARLHTETEFPGTGIGLATVHRIITRHGGRIWADGDVDGGATFHFTTEADPG